MLAPMALAGPWVQADQSLYVRGGMAFEDHEGFDATRMDVYGEYGVTDAWTLSAKYERVDFEDSSPFDSDGWRVTARRRVLSQGRWIASFEGGLLEGAALGGFRGCESLGGEIGAGLGFGTTLENEEQIYAGVSVARREHQDDCYHNRFEAVYGATSPSGWTWTYQFWAERGEDDKSDKFEVMLSRQFGMLEPGIAFRREIGGDFEETAVFVSLAFRARLAD